MTVRAVCFDVGETLISEERVWHRWAEWLGVPAVTFIGVLGGVIERGEHHLEVFRPFLPGSPRLGPPVGAGPVEGGPAGRVEPELAGWVEAELARRTAAGHPTGFDADDLYPDAVPALRALKADGYAVGVVGNQPAAVTEALFPVLGVELDLVASSHAWGFEKPDPRFFAKLAEVAGLPPAEIAYVGDRVDNDVLPALAAGMVAVFLRRGPWGYLHDRRPEARHARLRIESLAELPAALRTLG